MQGQRQLLVATTLLFTLLSSPAFAVKKGFYLGLDGGRTRAFFTLQRSVLAQQA